MLLETRIWQALHVLAILVTAFVTLYGAFYVPSAFTEKRLQRSLFFAGDVTSALSALGDRIKLSILIDNTPVNNLVLLIGSISNTGSVAIIPSDFYENLSINVDKEWKILLAKNSTGKEHPVWKKVNDQKFEASPELLNPGDSITVNVYATPNPRPNPTPVTNLTGAKSNLVGAHLESKIHNRVDEPNYRNNTRSIFHSCSNRFAIWVGLGSCISRSNIFYDDIHQLAIFYRFHQKFPVAICRSYSWRRHNKCHLLGGDDNLFISE